jgi:hypothetical protein
MFCPCFRWRPRRSCVGSHGSLRTSGSQNGPELATTNIYMDIYMLIKVLVFLLLLDDVHLISHLS